MKNSNICPINIFDFDGTLTTETWPKFWVWAKKFGYDGTKRNIKLEKALSLYRENHSGNSLETFFGFFNDLLVHNNASISYEELMEGEEYIVYNPGLEEFAVFSNVKQYIVSGGIKEFLANLKIARYFDDIYGSAATLNDEGNMIGIKKVMTDDKKVDAIKDILRKNGRSENDCRNVYYIGDGYSDEEAMRFVHNNGGKAILVYQPGDEAPIKSKQIYQILNKDGKVDFYCVADYRKDKELARILKRID